MNFDLLTGSVCICVCKRKDIKRGRETDKVKGVQSERNAEKREEEREISLLTSG